MSTRREAEFHAHRRCPGTVARPTTAAEADPPRGDGPLQGTEPPPGIHHLLDGGRCPRGGDVPPRTVLAQHLTVSVCKHQQS